jgi:hypothetical protein
VPLTGDNTRRTLFFQPDGPGFVRLTVMDARGAADSVMVRVQKMTYAAVVFIVRRKAWNQSIRNRNDA